MADIDTSIYPTTQPQPFNALDTFGKYTGVSNALVQNQLLGQHLQQQQIATQRAQGQQRIAQLLNESIDPNTGQPDYLKFKSMAAKDPLAAMNYDQVEAIADPQLASTSLGFQPNGAQRNVTLSQAQRELSNASNPQKPNSATSDSSPQGGSTESAPNQSQDGSPPGIAGNLAPGQQGQIEQRTKTNQQYVTDTRNAAADAPNQITMLDKIKALAQKTKTGPYADRINNFRAGLAEIFGTDPKSPATYEQLNKYMLANGLGQAAQNGANSDARTLAYVNSNPNTGILPEAVLPLADYQQALYRQKMGEANGLEKSLTKVDPNNPTQLNPSVEAYRQNYRNNTNPQFYEYKNLPDKEAKQTYLATHPGFAAQIDKLKKLKDLGAID